MKLTVLLTQPEFTVDISPREILSCSTHEDMMEMVRNKLKHALTHPKHFRVDPKSLMQIVDYWHNNFVEKPMFDDGEESYNNPNWNGMGEMWK